VVEIAKEVVVKIQRFDPKKDKKPYHEEFTVPYTKGMRILDAVIHVQRNYDTTLAYRWNCRSGLCGSCGIEVDGKPCLACKTPVTKDKHTVEPMKAFPVIKDLVPEVDEVREKLAELKPYFVPKETENKKEGFFVFHEHEMHEMDEAHECIECYVCYDSCHVTRNHKELNFCGPSNVVKAVSFERHPLDKGGRAQLLHEKGNIWQCNMTRCCSENCPQDISITENFITYAKERIVDENNVIHKLFRRIFSKGGEK